MRRRARKPDGTPEAGVTPLLDVVFILLIFFIVTTSFIKEVALDLNQPSQTRMSADEASAIWIRIAGDGRIFVESRLVDKRAVRAGLESELAAGRDRQAVIVAERGVHAGVLVHVVDQVRLTGIKSVALAAQPGFHGTTTDGEKTRSKRRRNRNQYHANA